MNWLSALLASLTRADVPALPLAGSLDAMLAIAPTEHQDSAVVNVNTGMGGSFDPGASARTALGQRTLSAPEARFHGRRGYGKRIVEIVPDDATRKGWIIDDGTPDTDPFADEDRRLHIVSRFREADVIARRDGGCFVFMATDDVRRPDDLVAPLRVGAKVLAIHAMEPWEAVPVAWNDDPSSPEYRKPSLVSLSPMAPAGAAIIGARVHASRFCYVDGADVDRQTRTTQLGYGDSVLIAVWDALRNLISHDQAGATIVQRLNIPVVTIEDLAALGTGDEADLFQSRMQLLAQGISMLNIAMLGKGEKYEHKTSTVSGYAELGDRAKEALAAVAGIPMTRLFGESPGGLGNNGETSRNDWAMTIAAHQEAKLREPLTYLYSLLYAAQGATPKTWAVKFLPLDEPTAKERAETRKTNADTDQVYFDMGALSADHVARSRFSERGYSDDILPMTDAEIGAIVDENEPDDEPVVEPNAPVPAK